jgi:hypothetical protein
VDCIHLVQDGHQRQAVRNAVVTFWFCKWRRIYCARQRMLVPEEGFILSSVNAAFMSKQDAMIIE